MGFWSGTRGRRRRVLRRAIRGLGVHVRWHLSWGVLLLGDKWLLLRERSGLRGVQVERRELVSAGLGWL